VNILYVASRTVSRRDVRFDEARFGQNGSLYRHRTDPPLIPTSRSPAACWHVASLGFADEHVWGYLKGMFRRETLEPADDLRTAVDNSMKKWLTLTLCAHALPGSPRPAAGNDCAN
jgi:hypothetical protein